MDTIEAIHSRRSIRDYEPRRVPRELIELVLLDAAQAPTPPVSGDQPFAFIVIEGPERVAECGALALRYARDHRQPGHAYDWVERPDFSVFFNASVVIVICGSMMAMDKPCRTATAPDKISCSPRIHAALARAG